MIFRVATQTTSDENDENKYYPHTYEFFAGFSLLRN